MTPFPWAGGLEKRKNGEYLDELVSGDLWDIQVKYPTGNWCNGCENQNVSLV